MQWDQNRILSAYKIIQHDFLDLLFPFYCAMLSGMCKICTHLFFFQFPFLEYISDMTSNISSILLKQLRHLGLRKPHGFIF